jgi:GTPase Era involved in 16S rRNA processing
MLRQQGQRGRQSPPISDSNTIFIDPPGWQRDHRDSQRILQNTRKQTLTYRHAQSFRVVQILDGFAVEDDCGGDQRASQSTPPSLIGSS